MHHFEVWAPKAQQSLEVEIGEKTYPLKRGDHGVWSGNIAEARHGVPYKLVLDGAAWPDPASHYQPKGPHGTSQIVDHSKFVWSDQGFKAKPLSKAVIYELHIGTFTRDGTYTSTIEKLDYLNDLGITHIQVMPLAQTSGDPATARNWGYDGTFWNAPNAAYGTPDDLKKLIDECHARNIAVILDGVYNHKGNEGNYAGLFSDHYLNAKVQTPWGAAVNLDAKGSDHVRKDITASLSMWLRDYHFDGFRLDATHELHDHSAMHILEEISCTVEKLSNELDKPLELIAETDRSDPKWVKSAHHGGYGMSAIINDDFGHAIFTNLTGEQRGWYSDFNGSLEQLAVVMRQAALYDGTRYSAFRDSTPGRSFANVPPDRMVVGVQNHDRVGNRAAGDRLGHIVDDRKAKISPAITLLSRFVPEIFMGEEFNASTPFQYFTSHMDPLIARLTTEGRRDEFKEFGFDANQLPNPQDPATFHRSKLNLAELERDKHKSMHQWYKDLIAIRHSINGFGKSSSAKVSFNEDAKWITMTHSGMTLLCNLSDQNRAVPLKDKNPGIILASEGFEKDRRHIMIPPYTAVVVVSEHATNNITVPSLNQLRVDAGVKKTVSNLASEP